MLNICIIEDDGLAADLLKEYIASDEMRVVQHYSSAEDALANIPRLPLPDAILMDVGLPGISGVQATAELKAQFPDLEIIMLTTFEDSNTIISSIRAGASGYLLKASRAEEIRGAIRQVCQGGSTLSGSVARKLLREFQQSPEACARPEEINQEILTDRERMILDRLIKGDSYKVIAADLVISVHTVNNHIRHIYRKLHVSSRAAAVAKSLGLNEAL